MRKDLIRFDLKSSFLSCEKDAETIIKKLFVESRPYSDELKRLLIINTKDCLDNRDNPAYLQTLEQANVKYIMDNGYVRLEPRLQFGEFAETKSYILLSFDNFIMNATNPEFRDCSINFDIICHTDCWDIGDFRLRPLKICGYIDAILNNAKLSGIGILNFIGCSQLILSEDLTGYTLMYRAVHGSDDIIPREEE